MSKRPTRKLDKAPRTRKRTGSRHVQHDLAAAAVMEQISRLAARLPQQPEEDESQLPATMPRRRLEVAGTDIENPSRHALEMSRGVVEVSLRHAVQAGSMTAKQADRRWQQWVAAMDGRPEPGDNRTPLVIDGQAIRLLDDPQEGLTELVTLRLPGCVVERLRDAAALLHPHRTMAGMVTIGVTALLDQIEAQLIRQTGQGIPPRPAGTQLGGRPQRLRQPKARRAARP